ncbi:MAG: dipeptidase [Chlamydiales bacterium]
MNISDFKRWYALHREEIQRDYFTFLSFPSISTDPAYEGEVQKTAEWLSTYLTNIGMKSSVMQTIGKPVVLGEELSAGPSRPTVLIYQHYDVQPVDPIPLWRSDPFKPEVRAGEVFARGAVDNKGQCFYSISAIRAFLQLCKERRVNVKLLIEGEEESGSRGTFAFLEEKQADLTADHLFVIDFDLPKKGEPGITLGMRGLVSFTVTFQTSGIDLHSGMHGGIALNANRALATTLAKLWDENGKVAVPHFYDDVQIPSKEESAILSMRFDEAEYLEKFGVEAFCMEKGFSPLESNWFRPSLEINGMQGGYSGPGVKTVIPAHAEAKLSCRLVANQDPKKIAESIVHFLKKEAPKGVKVESNIFEGARAFQTSSKTDAVQRVRRALEEVFGKPCQFQMCGATVPIVPALVKASGAEAVLFGMGLDDDSIHAPNEHFGLDRFEQGFLTVAHILSSF